MDRGKSYAEELDYEEDHSSFISRIMVTVPATVIDRSSD
jgi:hypothetical protein